MNTTSTPEHLTTCGLYESSYSYVTHREKFIHKRNLWLKTAINFIKKKCSTIFQMVVCSRLNERLHFFFY